MKIMKVCKEIILIKSTLLSGLINSMKNEIELLIKIMSIVTKVFISNSKPGATNEILSALR